MESAVGKIEKLESFELGNFCQVLHTWEIVKFASSFQLKA